MNISKIHNDNILNTFGPSSPKKSEDFTSYFTQAISKLEKSQTIVTDKQKEFVNGDIEAHELLAVVAESEISLKLATSITGKLVSALQEVTNLQI